MKRIVISVINDLVTDQRVQRTVGTLRELGFEILLIGRKLPGSLQMPEVPYGHLRFRMIFRKGPFFYAFFNIRLFLRLLFMKRPVMLYSNDLDTLPANYLVSKLRNIPLLYDSHEYFTEVPELTDRPGVRKFWEGIERRILPRIENALTVSQSIASEYQRKYGTFFHVIRNVPLRREVVEDAAFRERYSYRFRIIYQGALNMGRGIELMIASMNYIPDAVFFIVGDGDIREQLMEKVRAESSGERVVFLGRVHPETLHKITCQCDLGVSLEEDLGLNYRMALPNKIFDYIQARIPVMVSDLPEMSALVRNHDIGEVCGPRDSRLIAKQVIRLLNDAGRIREIGENLEKAANELCWEKEKGKLKDLISGILDSTG